MRNGTRAELTVEQKAEIVRRHLAGREPVSALAEELDLEPGQIDEWVEVVLGQAETALEETDRFGRGRRGYQSGATRRGRPRHRWYQFSIASLLLLLTLGALCMSFWSAMWEPYRAQARAAEQLRKMGAKVAMLPALPEWLRWLPFEERLQRVVEVHAESRKIDNHRLACLKDLPDLERLYLAGTALNDEGLSHVAQAENIRRLSLWRTKITDAGLPHLAHLHKLEVVDIHATQLTDKLFEHLDAWPRLYELRHSLATDCEGVARLARRPEVRLHHLEVSGLSDEAARQAAQLEWLSSLHLVDAQLSAAGVSALAQGKRLVDVRFSGGQWTEDSTRALRSLAVGRSVSLVCSDPAAPELRWAAAGPLGLHGLGLYQTTGRPRNGMWRWHDGVSEIAIRGPDALTQELLAGFTNAGRIIIASSNLHRSGLDHLMAFPSLTSLHLEVPFHDEVFAVAARANHLQSLALVPFSAVRRTAPTWTVTPEGMRPLTALRNLRQFEATGLPLSDGHLAFLNELTNLQSVNLIRVNVGNESLQHLARCKKLERLSLAGCRRIGDEGMKHLSGLPQLKVLDLRSTMVSDGGLVHLEQLPKLSQVWYSDRATPDGRQRLEAALARNSSQ